MGDIEKNPLNAQYVIMARGVTTMKTKDVVFFVVKQPPLPMKSDVTRAEMFMDTVMF